MKDMFNFMNRFSLSADCILPKLTSCQSMVIPTKGHKNIIQFQPKYSCHTSMYYKIQVLVVQYDI